MKKKNKKVILFIGDSITDVKFNKRTRHLKSRKSYPIQVADKLGKENYKYYFKGIASNRSYHVCDRLDKDCINLNPDIVVMLIGVNDAWQRYAPQNYPPITRFLEPHFREILTRLKQELKNDAKVIILLPFMLNTVEEKLPFKTILSEDVALERNIAEEFGYPIIDLQSVFDKAQETIKPATLATDGIHPTVSEHKIIADEVLKALAELNIK